MAWGPLSGWGEPRVLGVGGNTARHTATASQGAAVEGPGGASLLSLTAACGCRGTSKPRLNNNNKEETVVAGPGQARPGAAHWLPSALPGPGPPRSAGRRLGLVAGNLPPPGVSWLETGGVAGKTRPGV